MAILWERMDERKKRPGEEARPPAERAARRPARPKSAKPVAARTVQIVERILDGQTLLTRSGEYLRLARIEVPPVETSPGLAAKCWLTAFCAPGVTVAYERKRADDQGRTIAEVYVLNRNVSDLMLKRAVVGRPRIRGAASAEKP